jgi:hypothetical protein
MEKIILNFNHCLYSCSVCVCTTLRTVKAATAGITERRVLFTTVVDLKATPLKTGKHRNMLGFATTSFVESELCAQGKGE